MHDPRPLCGAAVPYGMLFEQGLTTLTLKTDESDERRGYDITYFMIPEDQGR